MTPAPSPWQSPSGEPLLEPGQADIWRLPEADAVARVEHYRSLLSKDERLKAEQFRFEADRDRYTACRGVLRLLLARYLHRDAAELRFEYSSTGKPRLAPGHRVIEFNVSHTRGMALLAFSDAAIGVDVERVDRRVDVPGIARRFLHPNEFHALLNSDAGAQPNAFATIWSCKEAVLKLSGAGILDDLHGFDVSGILASNRITVEMQKAPGPVTVRCLDVGESFAGAVATSRSWTTLRLMDASALFENETNPKFS